MALGRPNTCQLDITYGCGLRCVHCYVAGYNRKEALARELSVGDFKKIVDKLKALGVLWICFSGGDPLARKDFIELYRYAYQRGFLVTVFTGGYFLSDEHIALFKEQPPFCVEITLNAVEEGLYENISGVKGSFAKAIAAIEKLKQARIPLKLKAVVMTLNFSHLKALGDYARRMRLSLTLDYSLHAGLNQDLRPLAFRIPPEDVARTFGCPGLTLKGPAPFVDGPLFTCNMAGGDALYIDPYGDIALCPLIRKPKINALRGDLKRVFTGVVEHYKSLDFKTDSLCKRCVSRDHCGWCPGAAYAETASLEEPLEYCCSRSGKRKHA